MPEDFRLQPLDPDDTKMKNPELVHTDGVVKAPFSKKIVIGLKIKFQVSQREKRFGTIKIPRLIPQKFTSISSLKIQLLLPPPKDMC